MIQHGQFQNHYAQWKKPVTGGHILCDFIYMTRPEEGNPETQTQTTHGCQGLKGEGLEESELTGLGFLWGEVKKTFSNQIWWWLYKSANLPKPTGLRTWNGWIVLGLNYISVAWLLKIGVALKTQSQERALKSLQIVSRSPIKNLTEALACACPRDMDREGLHAIICYGKIGHNLSAQQGGMAAAEKRKRQCSAHSRGNNSKSSLRAKKGNGRVFCGGRLPRGCSLSMRTNK